MAGEKTVLGKLDALSMNYDLLDKDGNLNLDYTEEGLHITDKGYKVITDVLKPYVYELKK